MTTEAWTLIGVVVGAILGGLAQVLAGHLQGQRDRARERRETTRELYLDAIAFAFRFSGHVDAGLAHLSRRTPRGDGHDDAFQANVTKTVVTLMDDFDDFDRRVLILRAVGNKDVVDRLLAVQDALREGDGGFSLSADNRTVILKIKSALDDLVEAISRAL